MSLTGQLETRNGGCRAATPRRLCGLFLLHAAAFCQSGTYASESPRQDLIKAQQAYLDGARLIDRQDLPAAQEQFAKAAALAPSRRDYSLALTLTREHRVSSLIQSAAKERLTGHPAQADALLAEARRVDPQNELVLEHDADAQTVARTQSARRPEISYAPPIQVVPAPGPQDLHLRGDTRHVLTQAALAYGVKTVFDESVPSTPLKFDLEASPYSEAMPILLKMARLFAVPVDTKTLLIAKDTEENRARLERQVEESIYIPASTVEQLNELKQIITNVFDVKQVVVSQGSGTLTIKAPANTIKALNYTLADLVDGGAEVTIEVKLISINKTRGRNTGAVTPTSVGIFSVAAEAEQIVSANQSAVNLLISSGGYTPTGNAAKDTIIEALYLVLSGAVPDAKVSNLVAKLGGGLTLTGVYLGSGATLNLGLNSSDSRALEDVTVRVANRQTATLKVGERYPITTATYGSGISSATASALQGVTVNGVSASSLLNQYLGGGSVATVPQVQYEDLGLTLKTTPTILKSGLVNVSVDLKLEALTGTSSNGIPVLTNSNYVSDITVQDGASVIMVSNLSRSEAASISGLPGLGNLPGFQQTLADTLAELDSSELVLMVTPHIVRHRSAEMASRRIRFNSSVPGDN